MYNQGFFNQGNDVSNPLVFDAAIWIWDGSENFTPTPPFFQSSGSYVLHDVITGTSIQNGEDLPVSPNLVAPFQSFWVRRTSAYTARRVNEDATDLQAIAVSVPSNQPTDPAPLDKTTNAPLTGVGGPLTGLANAEMKPSFRTDCSIVKHYKTQNQYDVVKLRVSNGNHSSLFDETLLTFGSQFTAGYDLGYDISRNSAKSGDPFLVTEVSGKGLVINRMPYPVSTTQMPLFFAAENDNTPYVLEIKEASEGYTVYVEDLKTGKWHELSKSAYTFINDVSYEGIRFILHFKMGPVDVSEFQPAIRAWRSQGELMVQFNNILDEKARVRVADATGRLIYQAGSVPTNEMHQIPAHQLTAGIYFITVITESGSWVEKLIW
jgi:hypothetical protein